MRPDVAHPARRILEYDALRRRVWILGQRCHHGATGSVVAAVGVLRLVAERELGHLLVMAAGGALMAHDWHDRSVWFERGRGSQ